MPSKKSTTSPDPNEPAYPWAQLFDLESRIAKGPSRRQEMPGRPHRAYVRRQKTVLLSDEEISLLDGAELAIKEAMRPATVTKSQVIGLAVRLLSVRVAALMPDRASGWEELVRALFQGRGEER